MSEPLAVYLSMEQVRFISAVLTPFANDLQRGRASTTQAYQLRTVRTIELQFSLAVDGFHRRLEGAVR